jgi:hypothetical protein
MHEDFGVLRPGGYALLREPKFSMGDWHAPRTELTTRERGIPLAVLRNMIRKSGFEVLSKRKCMFPLTSRLNYFMSQRAYDKTGVDVLGQILCVFPVWVKRYHARNMWEKIRPTGGFFALRKLRNGRHV